VHSLAAAGPGGFFGESAARRRPDDSRPERIRSFRAAPETVPVTSTAAPASRPTSAARAGVDVARQVERLFGENLVQLAAIERDDSRVFCEVGDEEIRELPIRACPRPAKIADRDRDLIGRGLWSERRQDREEVKNRAFIERWSVCLAAQQWHEPRGECIHSGFERRAGGGLFAGVRGIAGLAIESENPARRALTHLDVNDGTAGEQAAEFFAQIHDCFPADFDDRFFPWIFHRRP